MTTSPAELKGWDDLYPRVERAIAYIAECAPEQPALDDIARQMALSPSHAQRVFQRWAGISPKRLTQVLTWATARERLREGASVLDAALDAELSGPGRLHDLAVSLDAMTPGEAKLLGAGLEITVGSADTPLGQAVIASTGRGVCAVRFVDDEEGGGAAREEILGEWPSATILDDHDVAADVARRMFSPDAPGDAPLSVLVRGTNFQVRVWRALLEIPEGKVVSYDAVARRIGKPTSARAVGQAVGKNPVGWLIPCHRVLRASAELSGYRWGTARKRAMLVREASAQLPH